MTCFVKKVSRRVCVKIKAVSVEKHLSLSTTFDGKPSAIVMKMFYLNFKQLRMIIPMFDI